MITGTFYTLGEVAELLGKHRMTITRWHKKGDLQVTKIGNLVLISDEEVQRIKAQRQAV